MPTVVERLLTAASAYVTCIILPSGVYVPVEKSYPAPEDAMMKTHKPID
jgi:hypothetical protein